MGGNRKGRFEDKADKWQMEGRDLRARRAQEYEDLMSARGADLNDRATNVRNRIESSGVFDDEALGRDITTSSYGRGREGYDEYARTGGFSPEERDRYISRSTSAIPGIYGRQEQELERRNALTGGYNPGFTASRARLERMKSNDTTSAKQDAMVNLESQIRAGRLAGLGGLERTREAAGQEAMGRYGQQAQYGRDLATNLNQTEVLRLQSRLATGQMDQNDISILLGLAQNNKSLFDKIMASITAISGAAQGAASMGMGV